MTTTARRPAARTVVGVCSDRRTGGPVDGVAGEGSQGVTKGVRP
jgi:hypothetical protein